MVINLGKVYRDRQANFRLIGYYIRHCDQKKLQKLSILISNELTLRSK